jgi:hypothetical protein
MVTKAGDQPVVESEPSPQFVELYKLVVEMADRTSARRGLANSFFLTLNTGFAAFAGATLGMEGSDRFRAILMAGIGIVLCGAWWILLRSYRQLNWAKFRVILAMEERLVAAPFGEEWKLIRTDPVKRRFSRYAELGLVERVVPLAFLLAYLSLAGQAVA